MDYNLNLGSYYENFISEEITSGKYESPSEVIKSALRILKEREAQIENLEKALIEGEESGFISDFNSDDFLKELNSKYE